MPLAAPVTIVTCWVECILISLSDCRHAFCKTRAACGSSVSATQCSSNLPLYVPPARLSVRFSYVRAAATGAFVFGGATGDLVGFLGVRRPEPVHELCTEDDLWLLVTGRRTYVEASRRSEHVGFGSKAQAARPHQMGLLGTPPGSWLRLPLENFEDVSTPERRVLSLAETSAAIAR